MHRFAMLPLFALLGACGAASAVVNVATLPVRAGAKAVDIATVSQSEKDEKRGRAIRQREERLGKLERQHAKWSTACARGDAEACAKRDAAAQEMDALIYEPS